MPKTSRVLIAGVGNVLHGDDGFGVVVANCLAARAELPPATKIIETGIGGMSLIQELMYGYGFLIILDACKRGGTPGQLYLLEPVLPDLTSLGPSAKRDYFADTHYATPMRALALLAHVASLPETVRIIGCEPEDVEDLHIGLSPPVQAAVEAAADMAVDLVARYRETGRAEAPGQAEAIRAIP
jgi:hydrogenase maturation protease